MDAMSRNGELIQLVMAWTLVGAFVFTVALTLLSLPGWIRFADRQQQKKLFYALIVELVAGTIAWFFGYIRLDAREVAQTVEDRTRLAAGIDSARVEPRHDSEEPHARGAQGTLLWNSDNAAATATWAMLQQVQGLKTSFRLAWKTKLGDLPYHATSNAGEDAGTRARALAVELDHAYRILLRARYEKGIDMAQAIDELRSVVENPANTVEDLALTTDRLYRFAGEPRPTVGE